MLQRNNHNKLIILNKSMVLASFQGINTKIFSFVDCHPNTTHKHNSKWIKDLNIRLDIIKLRGKHRQNAL